MKNIIILFGESNHEFNDLNEVQAYLFGDEYNSLSDEQKEKIRYERAFYVSKFNNNLPIVNTQKGVYEDNYKIIQKGYDLEKSIIIDNEFTYILSLCRINLFILLEKIDSEIFTKTVNKSTIQDNYIVVNTFANNILKKYYNLD